MFGMSSEEFWEQDPQLYWAYRSFYLRKLEIEHKEKNEYMKYMIWSQGRMSCVAHSISLNNAFSKSKKEFPKYDEIYEKETNKNKKLTKNEINKKVQEDFNSWARM